MNIIDFKMYGTTIKIKKKGVICVQNEQFWIKVGFPPPLSRL